MPGVSPFLRPQQPYSGVPGAYYSVPGGVPGMPTTIRQGPADMGLPPWLLPVALGAGGLILFMTLGRRRRAS